MAAQHWSRHNLSTRVYGPLLKLSACCTAMGTDCRKQEFMQLGMRAHAPS